MKQNYKGKPGLKERGLVWNIKVGIQSEVTGNRIQILSESRKWKMKVILN